jgi:uncharacterized protein (TIGR03067 family)
MKRVAVAVLVLAVPIMAWADDKKADDKKADDEAARAELKVLSGTWAAVGGEAQGVEIPKDELPFRWTFKAGGKSGFADRKRGAESPFAYTIDASKTPKVINFVYEGKIAALKDAKQYGIYKIEGGQLTICLTLPGATEKDRPKDFSTKEGRVMLIRFERAKDGE